METWKPINEKYDISDMGNVRNSRTGRVLNPYKGGHGYLYVTMFLHKRVDLRVNRLVAEAFIPNPDKKPEVNHKNGDKNKNEVTNLEWCTRSENVLHSYDAGLHERILTNDEIAYVVAHYRPYSRDWGGAALARKLGVNQQMISHYIVGQGG